MYFKTILNLIIYVNVYVAQKSLVCKFEITKLIITNSNEKSMQIRRYLTEKET